MAGQYLLPSIRQSVNKHAMHEIDVQAETGLSVFGPDASLIGAVAVVVDDILTNPTQIEKEVVPGRIPNPVLA